MNYFISNKFRLDIGTKRITVINLYGNLYFKRRIDNYRDQHLRQTF